MHNAFQFIRQVARLLHLPRHDRREIAFRLPPSAR